MLKRIGETIIKQMSKDLNIKTFEDVLCFDEEYYESKKKLYSQIMKVKEIAELRCINQNRPEVTNHMNAENPYKSKYGDDWLEK